MKKSTIEQLHCPYCLERFALTKEISGDVERVEYGLVKCGCFEFPIVEGILMLSLTKGYGGAEEGLLPYVALQTAAIALMKTSDLPALRSWIQSFAPLAFGLCGEEQDDTYLRFMEKYDQFLNAEAASFLSKDAKYGFIGTNRDLSVERRPPFCNWYVARFLTPRTASLRNKIASLRTGTPVLSLCCGHGIAEALLQMAIPGDQIVSLDGQFLNLLVVRRFINPVGEFICHDVQFPLPFGDAHFQFSLSSTCLPEIPSHAAFIREAIRVTDPHGCSLFDSIWAAPRKRVDPLRHYRYCQNEFEDMRTIVSLFTKCAPGRAIALSNEASSPECGWSQSAAGIERIIACSSDSFISIAISYGFPIRTATQIDLTESETQALSLSPLYRVTEENDETIRVRRSGHGYDDSLVPRGPDCFPREYAISKSQLADSIYLLRLYRAGILCLLPESFGVPKVPLKRLRPALIKGR